MNWTKWKRGASERVLIGVGGIVVVLLGARSFGLACETVRLLAS